MKQRPNPYEGTEPPQKSRLHFTPEERAQAAEKRAEVLGEKLTEARANLPQYKRLPKLRKEFDAGTGKVKTRLHFEGEQRPRGYRSPVGRAALGAGRALDLKVHSKLREVEGENVGTEAAHKTELTAETLATETTRFVYRHAKDRPYRTVRRLERQSRKANVNFLYRSAVRDNPELQQSAVKRQLQKRRIKREYAKAAREARKGASNAKRAAGLVGDAAKAVGSFVAAHKSVLALAALVVGMLVLLGSCMASCGTMLSGAFSSVFVPSYKAEDVDISSADLQWTEMETDLQEQIDNVERDHPGYDEYRFDLDPIGHDPFQLIAFLSAMYEDFQFSDVEGVLRDLFSQVYDLQFIEEVEVRSYTDEDGEEHEYNWYILNTVLRTRDFEAVVGPILDGAGQREMYEVYLDSLGGHQLFGNPLGYDWMGSITSPFGYRENPTGPGTQLHRGLDIGAASGSPLYSVMDGTVVEVGPNGSWGNTIVVDDGKGRRVRFAHCTDLLAANGQKVKKGEQIATVGSTGNSTGPHLHIEVTQDGQLLNPLFLLEFGEMEVEP